MSAIANSYDRRIESYAIKPDIRERLIQTSPGHISDQDLLAAILGSGSRGKDVRNLAREILDLIDQERTPPSADTLNKLPGVGLAQACRISAVLELGRRLYGLRERRITGPRDVLPIVSHWADRTKERFIVLTLNGAHEVLSARVISMGLVNRTVVHPREVYAEAIADRACAIIAAHNHPSGRLEPSPEDKEITDRLREAGRTLGIPLLDHVIFCQEGYWSFVDHGLLEPLEEG